jgi:hypothetical protein
MSAKHFRERHLSLFGQCYPVQHRGSQAAAYRQTYALQQLLKAAGSVTAKNPKTPTFTDLDPLSLNGIPIALSGVSHYQPVGK